MTEAQMTMQDMDEEYSTNTAGLQAIARSVEQLLYHKGLRYASCVGHFEFGITGPDSKTIAVKFDGKTYGVHVRDCFDLDQAPLIAEMLFYRIRNGS